MLDQQSERKKTDDIEKSNSSTTLLITPSCPVHSIAVRTRTSLPTRIFYNLFDIPPRGVKYSAGDAQAANASSKIFNFSLCRNRNFLLFILLGLVFTVTTGVPDTHSVKLSEIYFPDHKGESGDLVTVYGISSTVFKLVFGPLADLFPSLYARFLLYSLGVFMKGLCTSLTPFALTTVGTFASSLTMNALYGVADAAQYSLYTPPPLPSPNSQPTYIIPQYMFLKVCYLLLVYIR